MPSLAEEAFFNAMVELLREKFFVIADCDEFPVIDLGPFEGTTETFSLVYLKIGNHPQHFHEGTDARFLFHSGEGVVILGEEKQRTPFQPGTIVEVPRGLLHGFEVVKHGIFLVQQSKPITDSVTGKTDVQFAPGVCEGVVTGGGW